MSESMKGRWVGPMPVRQFMDSFFDPTDPPLEKPEGSAKNWKTHFKSLGSFTDASELCNGIQRLITTSEAIPGMKALQVLAGSDAGGYSPGKTTLSLFSDEDFLHATTPRWPLESMQLCITTRLSQQKLKQDNRSKGNEHKEYCTVSLNFEDGQKGCALCRNELVSHARTLLNYQYRTHVFIIHMVDPYARLIRFDRDGAIVSARFNYREHGDILLDFLWRFSNAASDARGRDPTVIRATADEAALAREKLAKWFKNHERPVYKLLIRDRELGGSSERKKMEVLVFSPIYRPFVRGRESYQGYIGYDPESDKVVFVKDSWRSTDPAMVKETDTLRGINSVGITEGVPVLLCGDDLEGRWQSTVTEQYSHEKWNKGGEGEESRRIHTRFVTDKVGKPVEKFQTSKDFLNAVYDAFRAHKAVYEKCQILHCDVSVGNLLVTDDGKGFLNDWDLARNVEDLVSGPVRAFRTGTWRFMSAYILARPYKVHALQDDIESFFWVVVYTILCFLQHNMTGKVKVVMEAVFDECRNNLCEDFALGGMGKINHVANSYPTRLRLFIPDNRPLTDFVERFRRFVISHHRAEASSRDYARIRTTERDMERDVHLALMEQTDSSPLATHTPLEALFAEVLAADGWPMNDSPHDYYREAIQQSADKRKADVMEDAATELRKSPGKKKKSSKAPSLERPPDSFEDEGPHISVHTGCRRSARLSATSSKSPTQKMKSKNRTKRR